MISHNIFSKILVFLFIEHTFILGQDVDVRQGTFEQVSNQMRIAYTHLGINEPGNPITDVWYSTHLQRPPFMGRIQIPRFVTALITPAHRNGVRDNFAGDFWTNRMEQMGAILPGDERGHMVGSAVGGPAQWYNFAPQDNAVNRKHLSRFILTDDWFTTEQKVRKYIENNCGNVRWSVALGYNTGNSFRPTGFRFHVQYMGQSNLELDPYFANSKSLTIPGRNVRRNGPQPNHCDP